MIATVPAATLVGVEGTPVAVEVHVSVGLPSFTVVGLPDAACRESRDRVRAALLTSDLPWPMQRITVNLAPSSVRKAGSGLDLAIAMGVLVASEELDPSVLDGRAFLGEVGLDGALRPVVGTVPMAAAVAAPQLVVPRASYHEAALVGRHDVRPVESVAELVACLRADRPWPDPPPTPPPPEAERLGDLSDVRGQPVARAAVEVAAAGGHHLLLLGPPGAGKTMLARRLTGLLPDLPPDEALEVTLVHSAAGLPLPGDALIRRPPLRQPHHGASSVALVGGGTSSVRPGEVSLAHRGVLFLDEMGEFQAPVLDTLRQPLESGTVHVARAAGSFRFPARFLLVGSMNPCPCGEGGRPGRCRCSDAARARYSRRLSGPLLDRFDLRVIVLRPPADALFDRSCEETSAVVAERVAAARERAARRGVPCNVHLDAAALDEVSSLTDDGRRLLEERIGSGALSARGAHRVRTVALTLADLAGNDPVLGVGNLAVALQLRAEPSQLHRMLGS